MDGATLRDGAVDRLGAATAGSATPWRRPATWRAGGGSPTRAACCRRSAASARRSKARRGWTVLGLLRLPFDAADGRLRYRAPLRGLVDVLEPDGPDAFRGRALLFGVRYGTFRMERL